METLVNYGIVYAYHGATLAKETLGDNSDINMLCLLA